MNEFQPGNLVKVINKCLKSRPRIYFKKYELLTEEEKNECQPIPCEDMLQDLKWKRRGCIQSYYINQNGWLAHWSNSEQLRYLLKMKHPENDDFIHIHDVRYIHQLQNIFKLITGKDLTE